MKQAALFFTILLRVSGLIAEERSFPQELYLVIERAREAAEAKMALLYDLSAEEGKSKGASRETSHKASYHTYSGPSDFADQIDLNDGSSWLVLPMDRRTVLEWTPGDPIAILKGDKHSNYRYRLHNERTHEIAEVELKGPSDNFNQLTIKDIDKVGKYLFLSDGSKWKLPTNWFEQEVWVKWYIGDIIIVGSNDQFFYSWTNPDILINYTCSATYTQSKCVN